MTLNNKQSQFTADFLAFGSYAVRWGTNRGYHVILEECYRHPTATHGHPNSTHRMKLAGHLLLIKDGVLVSDTDKYLALGEAWEELHPDNRWGGRFNDGVHFSRTHAGVA